MKKMMMTLAAVLCCAMTMTVFTACGSDDDNTKDGNGQKPQEEVEPGKLLSGSATFTVTTTGMDAIKAMSADGKIMVRYTYENGKVKTEELTKATYQIPLNYSFDDNGDIVASIQVYINDINEEKVREIIGTQFMEVEMKGKIVLQFENKPEEYAVRNSTNFKEFDRSNEQMLDAAVKTLKHDKERHGVIPFATYGLRANDKSISSSSSWLGN